MGSQADLGLSLSGLPPTSRVTFSTCFADLPLRECNSAFVLQNPVLPLIPRPGCTWAAPSHCCRGYKGTDGRHTGLLSGFLRLSFLRPFRTFLGLRGAAETATLFPSRLYLYSDLRCGLSALLDFLLVFPYTGISPNTILLASLTLLGVYFLGLFELTHGMTLDNYFILNLLLHM